jgi:hypothetical protein
VRASKNPVYWKIQNRYFYSVPYSNETLYMKALEYKTYFIHIDCEQILKSWEDIQVFFSIWNTECLAKVLGLCDVLTAFDSPRITMVLFVLKGVNARWDIYN